MSALIFIGFGVIVGVIVTLLIVDAPDFPDDSAP